MKITGAPLRKIMSKHQTGVRQQRVQEADLGTQVKVCKIEGNLHRILRMSGNHPYNSAVT